MKQPNKTRLRNWLIRISIFFGVAMLALVIVVIIALKPAGPTNEEIRNLAKKLEAVRSHFPAASGNSINHTDRSPLVVAATNPATTLTSTTAAGETDQARCDRLFLKLIHLYDQEGNYRELQHTIPPLGLYQVQRKELREMARFYEKGIRVSETARREFKLPYGRLLGSMLDTILNFKIEKDNAGEDVTFDKIIPDQSGRSNEGKIIQMTPEKADRVLEAMRFLRVTGCPAFSSILSEYKVTVNWLLSMMLDSGGKNWTALPPLPKQIETLPLELLAPRRTDGYEHFLRQLADMEREYVTFCVELTNPTQFFKLDWQKQKNWLARNNWGWKQPLYRAGGFCQSVFDTVVNHRGCVMFAQQSVRHGDELLDYMTRSSGGGPVENVSEMTFLLLTEYNDQIEARALAAALELRQGKAVPAPGSVTLESYCFDRVTRKPMLMFRSAAGPGVTRLYLAWPLRPALETMKRIGIHRHYNVSVLLSAGHPGLAAVPELESIETERERKGTASNLEGVR